MSNSAKPIRASVFLPWQTLEESDDETGIYEANAVEQAFEGRLLVRTSIYEENISGWQAPQVQYRVGELPYDPPVFIPEEERPEKSFEQLSQATAVLDVLTTFTGDIDCQEDVFSQLIEICCYTAEYSGLVETDLKELIQEDHASQQRCEKMLAVKKQLEQVRNAPVVMRGGTQIKRLSAHDEQTATAIAAVDRLERCCEVLIRNLSLQMDQATRLKITAI